MQNQKFNTSKQFLANKIFIPQPPQLGQVWTNLNVTLLPDYLVYLKSRLTKDEQLMLSDYHLQTYLLETAMKAHPKNDFDSCTNDIIEHIRKCPEFWTRKKGSEQQSLKMHQAIEQYQRDCDNIVNQCKKLNGFSQKQYRVDEVKKINEDYTYIKNQQTKSTNHKFTANLYPYIAQYIADMSQSENTENIRRFTFEFLVSVAIKAKPKIKPMYHYYEKQEKQQGILSQEIEKEVKKLNEYLQNNKIDAKSLSSSKDYYVISNCLIILRRLIMHQNFDSRGRVKKNIDYKLRRQKQNEIDDLLSNLVNRFANQTEVTTIVQFLIGQYSVILAQILIREEQEEISKIKWAGLITTQINLEAAYQSFNQIINHPQNTNRMKYKLEGSELTWTQDYYLKFLQNFLEFFNVPTNNKKIAIAMGKDIQPNHVKHVKGIYMRNMATRIQNGEIGGGKKGIFESKIEFLKKDIQNFNMRWFKKQGKTKGKRNKRRRKRDADDGEEHDSDY